MSKHLKAGGLGENYTRITGALMGSSARNAGLLGFAISAFVLFPGWLSADSVVQLSQASAWEFDDWHPIGMAVWWAISNKLVGPTGLLIQQLALYWGAWAFLAKALQQSKGFPPGWIVLVGLLPSFLLPFGHYWKDTQLASSMFFVCCYLIWVEVAKSSIRLQISLSLLLLLTYAMSVRPTAFLALLMIGWWLLNKTKLFDAAPVLRRQVLIALVAAASLLIPVAALNLAVPHSSSHSYQYLAIYDIQGIAAYSGDDYRPGYLSALGSSDDLKSSYSHENANAFVYQNRSGAVLTANKVNLASLEKAWLEAVKAQPMSYALHRINVFGAGLRLGHTQTAFVANGFSDPNPFGFSGPPNPLAAAYVATISLFPWLFWPWISLALSSASLFASFIRRGLKRYILIKLHAVAALYALPLVIIAPASDYRYYLPSILIWGSAIIVAATEMRTPDRMRDARLPL